MICNPYFYIVDGDKLKDCDLCECAKDCKAKLEKAKEEGKEKEEKTVTAVACDTDGKCWCGHKKKNTAAYQAIKDKTGLVLLNE